MRYTLILLFLFYVTYSSAQVRSKFYYNQSWELTTQDRAAFVRVCLLDTTNMYFAGPVLDLYLSGKPQMKGLYSRLAKTGPFVFFYENGNPESEGNFDNDKRMGLWKFYYPNGKIKMEVQFLSDVVNEVPTHYDSTGKKMRRGPEIDLDALSSKFTATENFVATGDVDFTTYPILRHMVRGGQTFLNVKTAPGESETIYEIKTMDGHSDVLPPTPNGDIVEMYKFIGSHLHYPPDARRAGIQGVVHIQYVVEKTGVISQVSVQKGIGGGCDEEAARVVIEYAKTVKWNPASRDGKPVRSRMVIPITFELG